MQKQDTEIRGMLSCDSSEGEKIDKQQMQPVLVKGATPHNENVTIDKLLV
jgi:hypothetical protein